MLSPVPDPPNEYALHPLAGYAGIWSIDLRLVRDSSREIDTLDDDVPVRKLLQERGGETEFQPMSDFFCRANGAVVVEQIAGANAWLQDNTPMIDQNQLASPQLQLLLLLMLQEATTDYRRS